MLKLYLDTIVAYSVSGKQSIVIAYEFNSGNCYNRHGMNTSTVQNAVVANFFSYFTFQAHIHSIDHFFPCQKFLYERKSRSYFVLKHNISALLKLEITLAEYLRYVGCNEFNIFGKFLLHIQRNIRCSHVRNI